MEQNVCWMQPSLFLYSENLLPIKDERKNQYLNIKLIAFLIRNLLERLRLKGWNTNTKTVHLS